MATLLLLLSREHLSPDEQDIACDLARHVDHWPGMLTATQRLRGLTFVQKHITELGLLPPNSEDIEAWMKASVMRSSVRLLTVGQAQEALLKTCIEPLGLPHVFLKGLTLSAYYDNPMLRISRDIDVLVEPDGVKPILDKARAEGYKILLDPKSERFVESDSDLEAVLRLKEDIPLLSPEGVVVEVHRSLHEDLPDASISAVINAAEDAELRGQTYKVLPTALMFPYLCAHHTRHLWDTPNYIADISAIRTHASWDEQAVLAEAKRFRLRHVVKAALEFETTTRSGALHETGMPGHYAACFALHIAGQVDAQEVLEQEYKLVSRWVHKLDASLAEAWKVFMRQFSPTLLDYIQYRVPVGRKPFYWALGVRKIVSKSGRKLWQLGAR